ncbi:MAG: DUF262 domain-containing protein [Acidimicrobiales bacterium]
MKAEETTLQALLGGEKQYQIPLFQRSYTWGDAQFQLLWDDITDLADALRDGSSRQTHFLGSMVMAPSPSVGPAGVNEWVVVDGQQRLTTLTVLLAAIRDHEAQHNPEAVDRFNELYLINRWAKGNKRYKLLPTQLDRLAYAAIIDRAPTAGEGDGVGAAYRFFRKQLIQADDPDDAHDIERIEEVLMHRLALVWIAAQPGDNVHRIFESLNNTGVRLSQADLLRNYIFMRMPNLGETAYETLWLPMQKELGADNLELLIWLDLVLRGEHRVRRDAIYRAQQERLTGASTEAELEGFLTDLRQQGEFLKVILQPEQEGDPMARSALRRLADWGSQTVYPLAMHLLARRHQGTIDSAQVADALKIVEGYLVRRMIVGKASANINRILVSIVSEMDQSLPVAEAVRSYLSGGERRWYPTDEQLRQAVLREPFYWRGKSSQRMFVLRRLEDSYTNFEPVQGEKLISSTSCRSSRAPQRGRSSKSCLRAGRSASGNRRASSTRWGTSR